MHVPALVALAALAPVAHAFKFTSPVVTNGRLNFSEPFDLSWEWDPQIQENVYWVEFSFKTGSGSYILNEHDRVNAKVNSSFPFDSVDWINWMTEVKQEIEPGRANSFAAELYEFQYKNQSGLSTVVETEKFAIVDYPFLSGAIATAPSAGFGMAVAAAAAGLAAWII